MFEQAANWMDSESDAEFESSVTAERRRRRQRSVSPRRHDRPSNNSYGDTVFKDMNGRITAIRYNEHGTYYSFEYDKEGTVNSINRSDGWVWRKVDTSAFRGWVVRNYWESWKVDGQDCGSVVIDDLGVRATGLNADLMGLPERA